MRNVVNVEFTIQLPKNQIVKVDGRLVALA